ncbi:band 4.1-like protein 4 isoform X2 [Bicyclus anynana]|uniref:Band 4.1-like protein 4 isoform X2 n=1 Tax=Bicyclus anynana TaxID=110368 RepID=A0ABM3LYT1_BICAN|nr:band 4.1-like protein 4 isoform X2 [Bicyclus anynana]
MMDCLCPTPRTLACRVVLLDERELLHEIQDNSTGQALLDVVFRHLDLLETAYFGLRYVDQDNQTHWLDAGKRLRRQLRGSDSHTFYFGVKFYASDPCKLLEEITRYQLFLQLKQDVLRGRLPVNFDLAAELAAYVLQSELGDYDPRRHMPSYVSEFRLLAHQTPELEARAADIHRTLTGISPAQAELSYLDKVKWLDMYGVDLHPVLGEDSVEYFLGLAPSGLLLLRGKHTVATYYWPRVSKLYYKGRYFMIRVADKNNDTSTYGFESPTRAACRHLWRCCSDHHTFFRLQQTSPASADIFALGSRLRNSGRGARPRPPPAFTRTPSRRLARQHAYTSLHDVPKLEDLRIKDCPPEMKQPTSVHRPNSIISHRISGEGPCEPPIGPGGSPRSTRSAPTRRGLYSASPTANRPPPVPRHRSASVDSQSSNDSRSNRKHRHRSRRQQSDAESELSRGSGRSGRRHRRHRSRHKHESGSEKDDSQPDTKEYELVDSESQWKEVLRQTSVGGGVQVANVRRSQMEPETGTHRSSHRPRRHKKHRSRSRSPNEKKWLPSELKQHLEFSLVDTTGMTEEQLKEIPYTVVQTSHARHTKLRTSSKHRQNDHGSLSRREKSTSSHKSDHDNHNQGSLRSNSSILSTHRTNEKHGRRVYPSFDETVGRTGDDFLMNNGYKSTVTPALHNNNPYSPVTNSNSNSSSGELISGSARVSHEHTDSGLGADQDYAYSSERSSDSAKCGAGGSQVPRHASNNNIMVGESGSLARRYARPTRESRDYNSNVARTHARLHPSHARHDNTLDIILKPLIESTQLQSN